MKSCRSVIRQQGRIVGHFDITGEAALGGACVTRLLLGLTGGYQCDPLVSDNERCILGSMPEGLRVLSREKCYQPVTGAI